MKRIKQKGFGIIEVMFSVAIVSASFVTLMSLFAYNIQMEIRSRDKIIASYLAQESIENIRQKRDNNWFQGIDWMDGIPVGVGEKVLWPNGIYSLEGDWTVENVVNEDQKNIYQRYDGAYIQISNGSLCEGCALTKFRRYLDITNDSLPGEDDVVKIVSHVEYGDYEVQIVSYLYNGWR